MDNVCMCVVDSGGLINRLLSPFSINTFKTKELGKKLTKKTSIWCDTSSSFIQLTPLDIISMRTMFRLRLDKLKIVSWSYIIPLWQFFDVHVDGAMNLQLLCGSNYFCYMENFSIFAIYLNL